MRNSVSLRSYLGGAAAAMASVLLAVPAGAGEPIWRLQCQAGQVPVSDGAGWVCGDLPGNQDRQKFAFVTSQVYTGNLGGVSGADFICQSLANAGGLPGTYKAWLSTNKLSPAISFFKASVPYVRTDGVRIADNWDDLVDCIGGCLDNPLNRDELGRQVVPGRLTWTATNPDGTLFTGAVGGNTFSCTNWTSASTNARALPGNVDATGEEWTRELPAVSCAVPAHLYCFQQ